MPEFKLFHAVRPPRPEGGDEIEVARRNAYIDLVSGYGEVDFSRVTFEHVATLECPSIHDVFRATNSIDSAWYDDPAAGALRKGLRSTSVGDLAQDEDGNFHVCANFGWNRVAEGIEVDILEAQQPDASGDEPSL